jgi:hypothetical protein
MSRHLCIKKEVSFQVDRRRAGVELIKVVSDLWYDKSIEMVLFKINYWIKRKRLSIYISMPEILWANRLPF